MSVYPDREFKQSRKMAICQGFNTLKCDTLKLKCLWEKRKKTSIISSMFDNLTRILKKVAHSF